MTDEHRMEQLSRAYAQAVAAVCGCNCARPEPDYGVDLVLRRVARVAGEFRPVGRNLDVQLKSTTAAALTATEVTYDLDVRAYNLLRRSTRRAPAILVLLLLPPARADWLVHAERRLELHGGAYWLSLRGFPAVPNASSVRVHIPREPVHTGRAGVDNGSGHERGGAMTRDHWPTPEQIGAYLLAHGWRFARPMKQPGAVYAYHQLADGGEPVELFVPHFVPGADEVRDFASSVLAVVETLESFEPRDREAILADMLGVGAAATARAVAPAV